MIRKVYFLVLAMLVSAMSFAQHPGVQGVPRSQVKNSVKSEPAVVYPGISIDSIRYWVGTGRYMSALVVKWDDGKGGNKNLVWGYRWSNASDATGEAMLRAVAKEDPRFYMLVYGNTQYGAAIGGMGYDLNGNGNIALVKEGTSYSLTDGVCGTSTYDFDSWTSNDAQDHWRAGWYNGYWSYWVSDNVANAYKYSDLGASSRKLTDGSVDGWSYMSDMTTWYSNDMSGAVEYVTEPVSSKSVKLTSSDETTEPTTYEHISSLADLRSKLDKANDGDTFIFDPGKRGSVLENDNPDYGYEITKSVTIIGNGVIVGEGYGFVCFTKGKHITFRDMCFNKVKEGAIYVSGSSLTVDRCRFDGCTSTMDGSAIGFDNLGVSLNNTLLVQRSVFSNNKCTKSDGGGSLYIRDNATSMEKALVDAKIVSCTFVNNEAKTGSAVYVANYPSLNFPNNVFEGNTATNENGYTINFSGNNIPEERMKSLGYNVIEGSVTPPSERYLTSTDIIGEDLDPILSLQDGEYQVIKDGPAYNHLPANTVLDGITWPESDITGLAIDYTKATHSGACQLVYDENLTTDYTKGTFIMNEDWYGHQNSTINFLTDEGEWIYRVVQKENPGVELGCTAQYGTIYGDKFYVMSKQAKDPGASITGGRITVLDAKTMKMEKQIQTISVDADGDSNADGRGFLGVDEHKGYVGTSNGIFVFNLDNNEIEGSVKGTGNGEEDGGLGSLYSGQIGNMVRVNDRVYAVHQKSGLLVINPATDEVEKAISAPEDWGFGSVVLSKDGNLWLSLAAQNGSGQADTRIVKLDPATQDTTVITLPEGIYGPANSWYAWTPDCFCASKQNNVLYWNGGNSSWFSGKTIFKYDIDKNEFSTFLDYNSDPDGWQIYGASFRVDPVTDEALVGLYKSFGDPTYVFRRYDNTGKQTAEYTMISNYWFPSIPVYPDNEAPVVNPVAPVSITSADVTTVSLKDLATDADNMDAAIVKTVKSVSNTDVLTAEMLNGDLVITPVAEGTADIVLQVNSNGKLAETTVNVTVSGATGIGNVSGEGATEVARYTLDGKRLDAPQRGVNIVRMSDGTMKKVVVK